MKEVNTNLALILHNSKSFFNPDIVTKFRRWNVNGSAYSIT